MRRILALVVVMLVVGFGPVAARAEMPPPLDDTELADQRGGFVSAGGITFDFAADLRTFIDGQLALESRISLVDSQLDTVRSITLPEGTTILHQLDSAGLTNILINTASNRDFRQDLNITLTLPGFATLQRDSDMSRIGADLANQINVLAGLH